MKALAVNLVAALVICCAAGLNAPGNVQAVNVAASAQKKGDKDPKKKDPPGPPVVRDKRDRERGKEPPPKPKRPEGH